MSEIGATLIEAPPAARFLLQGADAALQPVAARFGMPLSCAINRAEEAPGMRAALRLGPDEWLLIAKDEDAVTVAHELGTERGDFSFVDISDRQIGLIIEGPDAALALNAGVPLDLSETSFPVGAATRTIFEKCEIILWRKGSHAFRIEVARSFAPYLQALLDLASKQNAAAP